MAQWKDYVDHCHVLLINMQHGNRMMSIIDAQQRSYSPSVMRIKIQYRDFG